MSIRTTLSSIRRMTRPNWNLLSILLGPLVAILSFYFVLLFKLSMKASLALAVGIWMVTWWVNGAVGMGATSLLPIVLFPLCGIIEGKSITMVYLSDGVAICWGSIIIAKAIERYKLHHMLAKKMVLVTRSWGLRGIIGGFVGLTAFLSMWLSNTATAALMVPLANAVFERLGMSCQKQSIRGDIHPNARIIEQHQLQQRGMPNLGIQKEYGSCTQRCSSRKLPRETVHLQGSSHSPSGDHTSTVSRERHDIHEDEKGANESYPTAGATRYTSYQPSALETPLRSLQQAAAGVDLAIAYASSLGGMATLTGTGSNLVLAGVLSDLEYTDDFNFVDWLVMVGPLCVVNVLLLWGIICLCFTTTPAATSAAFASTAATSASAVAVATANDTDSVNSASGGGAGCEVAHATERVSERSNILRQLMPWQMLGIQSKSTAGYFTIAQSSLHSSHLDVERDVDTTAGLRADAYGVAEMADSTSVKNNKNNNNKNICNSAQSLSAIIDEGTYQKSHAEPKSFQNSPQSTDVCAEGPFSPTGYTHTYRSDSPSLVRYPPPSQDESGASPAFGTLSLSSPTSSSSRNTLHRGSDPSPRSRGAQNSSNCMIDMHGNADMEGSGDDSGAGNLSPAQLIVLGVFCLMAVLWITRDPPGGWGWSNIFPEAAYITDGTVAVFCCLLLFAIPTPLSSSSSSSNSHIPSRGMHPQQHHEHAHTISNLQISERDRVAQGIPRERGVSHMDHTPLHSVFVAPPLSPAVDHNRSFSSSDSHPVSISLSQAHAHSHSTSQPWIASCKTNDSCSLASLSPLTPAGLPGKQDGQGLRENMCKLQQPMVVAAVNQQRSSSGPETCNVGESGRSTQQLERQQQQQQQQQHQQKRQLQMDVESIRQASADRRGPLLSIAGLKGAVDVHGDIPYTGGETSKKEGMEYYQRSSNIDTKVDNDMGAGGDERYQGYVSPSAGASQYRRSGRSGGDDGAREEENCPDGEGTVINNGPILPWREAVNAMNWEIIFLLGGGFALSEGFQKSGLSDIVADALTENGALNLSALIAFSSLTACAMSNIMSNVAAANILLGALQCVGPRSYHKSPLLILTPITLSISIAFLLPIGTPPNAIVLANGHVTVKQMFFVGLLCTFVFLGTILLYSLYVVPWVVSIGGEAFGENLDSENGDENESFCA